MCCASAAAPRYVQAGLTFAVDAARSNVETININTNTATTTATAPTAAGAADGYENVDARDNAVALYGMSLDALAMFLSEGGRHDAAANVYLKTLPVIASLSVDLQGTSTEDLCRLQLCTSQVNTDRTNHND